MLAISKAETRTITYHLRTNRIRLQQFCSASYCYIHKTLTQSLVLKARVKYV